MNKQIYTTTDVKNIIKEFAEEYNLKSYDGCGMLYYVDKCGNAVLLADFNVNISDDVKFSAVKTRTVVKIYNNVYNPLSEYSEDSKYCGDPRHIMPYSGAVIRVIGMHSTEEVLRKLMQNAIKYVKHAEEEL